MNDEDSEVDHKYIWWKILEHVEIIKQTIGAPETADSYIGDTDSESTDPDIYLCKAYKIIMFIKRDKEYWSPIYVRVDMAQFIYKDMKFMGTYGDNEILNTLVNNWDYEGF